MGLGDVKLPFALFLVRMNSDLFLFEQEWVATSVYQTTDLDSSD